MASEKKLFFDSLQDKKKIKMLVEDESFFKSFLSSYSIEEVKNREDIIIQFANIGQNHLEQENLEQALEISSILQALATSWDDKWLLMKTYLYQAQLNLKLNKDPLNLLKSALKIAKKSRDAQDIILGIKIQLAFTYYKKQEYKKALKELKKISKIADSDNIFPLVNEIKARILWTTNNYKEGFNATYDWFTDLSEQLNNIPNLFMCIVYLLTIMTSLPSTVEKEKFDEVKKRIIETLVILTDSVHLYDETLLSLDILFSESLHLVQPEILKDFANIILKNVRWNDPEKYIVYGLKMSELFTNLDENSFAIELLDKTLQFAKEKRYDKIIYDLQLKSIETKSTVFFFELNEKFYDPFLMETIDIITNKKEEQYCIKTLSTRQNYFPSMNYSYFLKLIEKVAENKRCCTTYFKINGINQEEERRYFLLKMEIEEEEDICLLVKEDFRVEDDEVESFQAIVSPVYTFIGVLDESEKHCEINDLDELDEHLTILQKALESPNTKLEIIFPSLPPHLDIYKYYFIDKDFKQIKRKILECALELRKKHPIVNNTKFQKLFDTDPLTIFDLMNRNEEQFNSLSIILDSTLSASVSSKMLKNFFTDLKEQFLFNPECRFWKDFYLQYSWIHISSRITQVPQEEREEIEADLREIKKVAKQLGEEEKILYSLFIELMYKLESKQGYKNILHELKQKSLELKNEKYQIFANSIEKILEKQNAVTIEDIHIITSNMCKISSFSDIVTMSKVFDTILIHIDFYEGILNYSENKKEEFTEREIFLLLNFAEVLEKRKDYEYSLRFLNIIDKHLKKIKDAFTFPTPTISVIVTQTYLLKLTIMKIKEQKAFHSNFNGEKSEYIDRILFNHYSIFDPLKIIELLVMKTKILIRKNDYAKASNYLSWMEQILVLNYHLFSMEENRPFVTQIQSLRTTIQKQHYI